VIDKATEPETDAYSAFKDTDLAKKLKAAGVTRVLVGGLATNYCVLETVRDAIAHGFDTTVIADACMAVGDGPAIAMMNQGIALNEMQAMGANIAKAACRA
jgi:nicotinamidase/pyrazinamidase